MYGLDDAAASTLRPEDHDTAVRPVEDRWHDDLEGGGRIEKGSPVDLEASQRRKGQEGQIGSERALLRRCRRICLGQDQIGEPGDGVEEERRGEDEERDRAVRGAGKERRS